MKAIVTIIKGILKSANQCSTASAETESELLGLPVGYTDYSPYM